MVKILFAYSLCMPIMVQYSMNDTSLSLIFIRKMEVFLKKQYRRHTLPFVWEVCRGVFRIQWNIKDETIFAKKLLHRFLTELYASGLLFQLLINKARS